MQAGKELQHQICQQLVFAVNICTSVEVFRTETKVLPQHAEHSRGVPGRVSGTAICAERGDLGAPALPWCATPHLGRGPVC